LRSPAQIQLNGNNWSPDTHFNTITPAIYKNGGGIHLEGAAAQTSIQPSPLGPNVIATIPSADVTSRLRSLLFVEQDVAMTRNRPWHLGRR
jgi:hypothetical protein